MNPPKPSGKVAIVTGAAKGIGAAIARVSPRRPTFRDASDDARWMTGETLDLTGGLR